MPTLLYDTGVYGDTYGVASVTTTPISVLDVKPPLDLHAEVVTADGTRFRWGSSIPDPAGVPQGVNFANKRYEGFERSSCALTRPIDRDYPDLGLFDSLNFIGYDGSVAHEGYISQIPRSTPYGIDVEATGWMASARHQKFREIYVDQDMSRWQLAPLWRQAELAVASNPQGQIQGQGDASGITFNVPNTALPQFERTELWYEAPPGVKLGLAAYIGERTGAFTNLDSPTLNLTDRPEDTTIEQYTLSLTNSVQVQTFTTARRRAFLLARVNTATTPAAGTQERYSRMGIYGDHGLPTQSIFAEPYGYLVSDMMRDICSRFCPRLDPSGIEDTTWPVRHAAWYDRIDPYDAWLELNKYHLWELAVWEQRKLYYHGRDMTDYDWQVKSTDPGVVVALQGPATDQLANYVVVAFRNLRTGQEDEVSPATHPELRDPEVENPANRHGLDLELGVTLSQPNDPDGAAQIGRALLAEHNAPKDIGTITVKGHIRDRAGHWQPGWKVRSSETIAITNFPNNRPRLVGEVAWNHSDKTATIAVDSTLKRVDAYLDRFGTALKAAGVQQ